MRSKVVNFKNFNILRVALFTLIIAIPLLPKYPLINVPGTYVAIRIEDFLLLLSSIFWLLWFVKLKSLKEFFQDNLNLAILFYLLVGAVSLLSAIFVTQSVTPHLGLLHYLRRIEYFLPFFIATAAIKQRSDIVISFFLLFVVTILVILYGIGQLYFGLPVISTSNEEFSKGLLLPLTEGARVNSTFAGHYDLAAYLAIVFCLAATYLFGSSWTRQQFLKTHLPLAIFTLASYWLLVSTESRISFVAVIGGLILILFLLKKRALIIPTVLGIVILGLFFSPNLAKRFSLTFQYGIEFIQKKLQNEKSFQVVNVAFAQVSKPPVVQPADLPRVTESSRPAEVVTASTEKPAPGEPESLFERIIFRSGGIRFNVEWPRAMRAFLKNPILGTGYSSITLATDNDYLRILGETGVLGFLSFLLIFFEISKRIIIFFKNRYEQFFQIVVTGITGVIVVMLVNALFIDVFEASKIAILFWTLMGILVATIRSSHSEVKENTSVGASR